MFCECTCLLVQVSGESMSTELLERVGAAIREIKLAGYVSLYEAIIEISRFPNKRMKISNGLEYGYDFRYGGFVLYENDAVLGLCCPVTVCHREFGGGHSCPCVDFMRNVKEKTDVDQVNREAFTEPFEAKAILTRTVRRVDWGEEDEPDIMTSEGQQRIRTHVLKNGQDLFKKSGIRTTVTAFAQFENLFIVTGDAQYGLCWGEGTIGQAGVMGFRPCFQRATVSRRHRLFCHMHDTESGDWILKKGVERMVVLALLEVYYTANEEPNQSLVNSDIIKWVRMLRWLRAMGSDGLTAHFGKDKVKVGLTRDSCMSYYFNDWTCKWMCVAPYCLKMLNSVLVNDSFCKIHLQYDNKKTIRAAISNGIRYGCLVGEMKEEDRNAIIQSIVNFSL